MAVFGLGSNLGIRMATLILRCFVTLDKTLHLSNTASRFINPKKGNSTRLEVVDSSEGLWGGVVRGEWVMSGLHTIPASTRAAP